MQDELLLNICRVERRSLRKFAVFGILWIVAYPPIYQFFTLSVFRLEQRDDVVNISYDFLVSVKKGMNLGLRHFLKSYLLYNDRTTYEVLASRSLLNSLKPVKQITKPHNEPNPAEKNS